MNRYLVESPHKREECARMIKDVYSLGSLPHFDWGCEADVHVGWAIVEAESEDDPETVRVPVPIASLFPNRRLPAASVVPPV